MRVQLNGETRDVPEGTTLAELVRSAGAPATGVAVEVNLAIVRRAEWEQLRLGDGDRVELVQLVGGG